MVLTTPRVSLRVGEVSVQNRHGLVFSVLIQSTKGRQAGSAVSRQRPDETDDGHFAAGKVITSIAHPFVKLTLK